MNNLQVYDRVKIVNSSDSGLDGQAGTVMGIYGGNSTIILFDIKPQEYDPAIVVVNQIIEKI